MIELRVYGTPGPQGSKSFMGIRAGRAIMVESSKKVKPWREAVEISAIAGVRRFGKISGPVFLRVVFTLEKAKSVSRKYPSVPPDLSKLIRSTEDALTTGGIWEDDARVIRIAAVKLYVGDPEALDAPGAIIRISQYPVDQPVGQTKLALS